MAEADPDRMMGQTKAWRTRLQPDKDEFMLQRPLYHLHTYTDTQVPHKHTHVKTLGSIFLSPPGSLGIPESHCCALARCRLCKTEHWGTHTYTLSCIQETNTNTLTFDVQCSCQTLNVSWTTCSFSTELRARK